MKEVELNRRIVKRAALWRKIVHLVKENGLLINYGQDEHVAVLEAVTQAFASHRICAAAGFPEDDCTPSES